MNVATIVSSSTGQEVIREQRLRNDKIGNITVV